MLLGAEPFPIKLENPYKKPIPKSLKDPDGDGTLKKSAPPPPKYITLVHHPQSPDLLITLCILVVIILTLTMRLSIVLTLCPHAPA